MTQSPRSPGCERAGLLLSLRADGAATPDQARELDAHLGACEACRRGALVDQAVGARLRFRGAGAAASPGFAERTAATAALAARVAAAAENRFLRITAAAAVVVAVGAGSFLTLRPFAGRGIAPEVAATPHGAARHVVVARLSSH